MNTIATGSRQAHLYNLAFVLGTASVLSSCGGKLGQLGQGGDLMKAAANCPDVSTFEAAAALDFANEFNFDPAVAGKVKAGAMASAELDRLAASIDAELMTACSGLASDLDAPGQYKNGTEACQAAMKAMADIKSKMGASASFELIAEPPVCTASLDAAADCAAKCDASVTPGEAEVKCEGGELSGKCEAECKGVCDLKASAVCKGECTGSCDAKFSGTCGGDCDGTCHAAGSAASDKGVASKGKCDGRCEGKCDAHAEGQCGGECDGSCKMESGGTCEGTCTGECSVEFKEPKCTGRVVPPKASAECQGTCDAHATARMDCTKPRVDIVVRGSADAEAAAKYQAAIAAHLPVILKVAVGMAPKLEAVAANAKATVEGAIAAGQGVIESSASAGARVSACLMERFTGALSAAASIKANVDVSVDVKASASASASGSAAGSGKAGAG